MTRTVNCSRRSFAILTGTAVAASLAGVPFAALAQPQAFPSRPIRFIVPFPSGSGTDMTARTFAKKIGELDGAGRRGGEQAGRQRFYWCAVCAQRAGGRIHGVYRQLHAIHQRRYLPQAALRIR
ncbi:hypothetical protein ACU4GD_01430 [Cupriavidus basilensis]